MKPLQLPNLSMTRDSLTTLLDLLGLLALVLFAGLIWWPLAIGTAGAAALVLSWRISSAATLTREDDPSL